MRCVRIPGGNLRPPKQGSEDSGWDMTNTTAGTPQRKVQSSWVSGVGRLWEIYFIDCSHNFWLCITHINTVSPNVYNNSLRQILYWRSQPWVHTGFSWGAQQKYQSFRHTFKNADLIGQGFWKYFSRPEMEQLLPRVLCEENKRSITFKSL